MVSRSDSTYSLSGFRVIFGLFSIANPFSGNITKEQVIVKFFYRKNGYKDFSDKNSLFAVRFVILPKK